MPEDKRALFLTRKYEPFLEEIRNSKPEVVRNYPLGVTRRANVIGAVAGKMITQYDMTADMYGLVLLSFWCESTTHGKRDYRRLVEAGCLRIPRTDPSFPTFQEWVTALAYTIGYSQVHGHVPIKHWTADMAMISRLYQKIDSAGRFFRGLRPIGAIINLATAFSSHKLPREGSDDWTVCLKACAQAEACMFFPSANFGSGSAR